MLDSPYVILFRLDVQGLVMEGYHAFDTQGLPGSEPNQALTGATLVSQLAEDLRREFPGMRGFSAATLWRMRNLYTAHVGSERLQTLVREIRHVYRVHSTIPSPFYADAVAP